MATESLSPSERAARALKQLLDGNARYVRNAAIHPASRPSAAPQSPLAVVLSCSDSRVAPELIFDQGVGALFVVRVAGNTYDRLACESIRFAVMKLGVALIIVIGHDSCGAVSAALEHYPATGVGPLVENIYPAISAAKGGPGDPIDKTVRANAIIVAERLAGEADFAAKVAARELMIVPARYAMDSGEIELLRNPEGRTHAGLR
ncbi:MAG TPA: carbonic anhydrase [Candidatus Binataceae bacterium]|jgi:carbonic anhydrase|nr:carbonic anhydrase [Candidatus Binataceae bacterium]